MESEGEVVRFIGKGAAEVVFDVADSFINDLASVSFGAEEDIPLIIQNLEL